MNTSRLSDFASRWAAQQRIEERCTAFEDALRAGDEPRIEDHLPEHLSDAERSLLLNELLRIELEDRLQRGESPLRQEYLQRFRSHGSAVGAAFDWLDSLAHDEHAASCESLAPGTRVGRYRVQRLLGHGSFGSVYLAHDEDLKRSVALKMVHSSHPCDAEARQRFVEEARALAHLRHPNILQIHDASCCDDGRPYLVVQYVSGLTLDEFLRQHKLQASELAGLFATIAEAAHHAHRRGIVHRDLQPRNIIVDDNRRPYVVDFGLAVHECALEGGDGEVAGTLPYMAPEQIRGEALQLDGRADVWAIGAMLYEALCGVRPFPQRDPENQLVAILHGRPKPVRQRDERIPQELEDICLRCLQPDAERRYSTAADLARALRRFAVPPRPPLPRLVMATAMAGLLLAGYWGVRAGLPSASWQATTAQADASRLQASASPESLEVLAWRGRSWRRIDEPGVLPLRAGDAVRIEAQLNGAFAYVIWLDGLGRPAPVYPWRRGDWQAISGRQQPVTRLALPSREPDAAWTMQPGAAGVETLVLLARSRPLPPHVDLAALLQNLPESSADLPPRLVAYRNGRQVPLPSVGPRAPDLGGARRLTDPVLQMQRLLYERLRDHFSLVYAVSFSTSDVPPSNEVAADSEAEPRQDRRPAR